MGKNITKQILSSYAANIAMAFEKIDESELYEVAKVLYDTKEAGRTIFIIGNGGSAGIASHMACDFNKGTLLNAGSESEKRFKVIALTSNVAYITAIGNDIGYEHIFVEQLRNLGCKGDVLMVISGSGNSPNLLKTIEFAKAKGLTVVGLLGFSTGGKCAALADKSIIIQSDHYGPVEDIHGALGHVLTCIFRTWSEKEAGLTEKDILNKATPFHFCPLMEEDNSTAA